MDLLSGEDTVHFWKKISEAKPSWQLALAQLVMPLMSRSSLRAIPGARKAVTYLIVAVKADMGEVADDFDPR